MKKFDAKEIQEHFDRTPQDMNPAFRRVSPDNRHLFDFVSQFSADVKSFNIKAKSVKLDAVEYIQGGLPMKELKSTLCIFNTSENEQLDEKIEGFAHVFSNK